MFGSPGQTLFMGLTFVLIFMMTAWAGPVLARGDRVSATIYLAGSFLLLYLSAETFALSRGWALIAAGGTTALLTIGTLVFAWAKKREAFRAALREAIERDSAGDG